MLSAAGAEPTPSSQRMQTSLDLGRKKWAKLSGRGRALLSALVNARSQLDFVGAGANWGALRGAPETPLLYYIAPRDCGGPFPCSHVVGDVHGSLPTSFRRLLHRAGARRGVASRFASRAGSGGGGCAGRARGGRAGDAGSGRRAPPPRREGGAPTATAAIPPPRLCHHRHRRTRLWSILPARHIVRPASPQAAKLPARTADRCTLSLLAYACEAGAPTFSHQMHTL